MGLNFFSNMPSNQKKAGKLLVGFFVAMALMTLVSKGLYGATIPRVKATKASKGTLGKSISLEGNVESISSLPVKVPSGFAIERLMVERGTKVKEGELLAVLDIGQLNEKLQDLKRAQEKIRLSAELESMGDDSNSLQVLAKSQQQVKRAEEDLKQAKESADASVERAFEELNIANRKKRKLEKEGYDEEEMEEVKNEIRRLQRAAEEAGRSASQAEIAAERALEDARAELSRLEEEENKKLGHLSKEERKKAIQSRLAALNLEEGKAEIAQLERLIAQGGKVFSPATGIVSGISTSAGSYTRDEALLLIGDDAMGGKVKVMVEEDTAKQLELGDAVEVKAAGSRSAIPGSVASIIPPEKKGGESEVTILIPNNAPLSGSRVAISIKKPGQLYQLIVPLTALHANHASETSGYVLVVREKATLIGTQLEAEKVPVEILDKNKTSAAIHGTFAPDDKIIYASSRNVS